MTGSSKSESAKGVKGKGEGRRVQAGKTVVKIRKKMKDEREKGKSNDQESSLCNISLK